MSDIRKYIDLIESQENISEDKNYPERYFDGLSKEEQEKRKKDFDKNSKKKDDDSTAYEPMSGDHGKSDKESEYTKKFKKKFNEDNNKISSLENKAKETDIPYNILKKVYDRGMAAWKTGHRPNTTPHQWGLARVNSFSVGGKTRYTADKDIWNEYKNKN